MNKILSWMAGALLMFLSLAAQAAGDASVSFLYTENEGCSSLSIGFTIAAEHTKKGDRGGLLNENTRGKIGECFFDKERRFYSLTGALVNSQWGPTLVHGYGLRLRSPQLWRLSGEIGYEVALTYYQMAGRKNRGEFIVLPLPISYVGVNFEMPSARQMLQPFLSQDELTSLPSFMQRSFGEITVSSRTLGGGIIPMDEKIRLYSITWTHRF